MQPIKPTEFGLATHRIQQFYAVVAADTTPEQLTDPALWVNVGPQMRMNDEIRVDAEDLSFTALIKVTYTAGTRVRLKTIYVAKMDVVDADAEEAANAPYFIVMKGIKKWCIVERLTAEIKMEGIPTKMEAMKSLDDYMRALAA